MNKKHFLALANILKDNKPVDDREDWALGRMHMWKNLVNELADFCQFQGSGFTRDRWLNYINGTRDDL